MRDALFLLLFCFVCYPRLLAQQLASFEGTVVNTTTGRPLSRVHLRLALYNPDEVVAPIYGAVSDDSGRFSITGIQPDVEYRLEAERQGVLPYPTVEQAPQGVIVHEFKSGEHLTGYKLEMAPRVVLSGRVVDEHGEPLADIPIIPRRVPQTVPTHVAPMHFTLTDDRGEFRLLVVPERYQLMAEPDEDRLPPEIRTDGSVDSPFLATYYPSALSRESAGVVEARAGADVSGLEIRPLRSAMLSIAGSVSGVPQGAAATVRLRRRDGYIEREAQADAAGQFSFAKLNPGTYTIYAQCCVAQEPLRSQVAEVSLANEGKDFVSLSLARGFDLEGRIAGAPAHQIHLFAPRTESDASQWLGRSAPVAADSSFLLKGLQPGEYEVEVSPLPPGAYIKTLRLGDTVATDSIIDLRKGPAALTVTIAAAGGEISGRLSDGHGGVFSRLGFVYAVQEGQDLSPRHRWGNETTADGTFVIDGLPPGKYRVFATVYGVTPFPPGADHTQLMREWAAAADLVEIHEGEKVARNAKVAGAK